MEMDDGFLEVNDIDWFALRQNGQLCHFATGGQGRVPPTITRSMEGWGVVCDFVEALPERYEGVVVMDGLPAFSSEKQLQSFVSIHLELARKGLHSHDAFEGGYILVAKPADESARVELTPDVAEYVPTMIVNYEEGVRFSMD